MKTKEEDAENDLYVNASPANVSILIKIFMPLIIGRGQGM